MDWKQALTKVLLQVGIAILTKFVPVLGGLLGGPLGLIAGWLMGKATDWLYSMIEQYLKFKEIDRDVQTKLEAAKAATEALRSVPKEQSNAAALEAFRNSVRDLGRVRLQ